ncbi:hypothetical protein [Sinomonas mesophila]|uniref:hypothetical protein n=1 Tax=Sinomonas mesophila TaxID=1531955 RepID=UPI001115A2B5|nr:hypothetical protein [Sinomonas mesophila]
MASWGRVACGVVLVVGAFLSSGCAPPTGGLVTTYRGAPPGVGATPTDFTPVAVWTGPSELSLVTYGSSSCPYTPAVIQTGPVGDLEILLDTPGVGPCTDDLAPTTSVIALPTSAVAHPLHVRLTFADSDREMRLTVR